MKVKDVFKRKEVNLTDLEWRVLKYIERHPDEVFPEYSVELAFAMGERVKWISMTLWSLAKKGKIHVYKIKSIPWWKVFLKGMDRVYFGTKEAIQKLKEEDEKRL